MHSYENEEKCSPHLVLDKISITLAGFDGSLEANIKNAMKVAAKHCGNIHNLQGHGSLYRYNLWIISPNNNATALVQAEPKAGNGAFARLEFNPSKWDAEVPALKFALESIFPGGFGTFLEHGRVTRIDIAVDLPHVPIQDINVFTNRSLTSRAWKMNGDLETIVIGRAKSGNQIRVYDKRKEMIAAGSEFPAHPVTRIEKRVGTNTKLLNIKSLKNPMANVLVVHQKPPCPPGMKKHMWELFTDSCVQRGPVAAIGLLPKNTKPKFKAALKKYPIVLWKPAEIWESWPMVLAESGLTSAS